MDTDFTWDPHEYARFSTSRLRPAVELPRRVDHPGPHRVHELGTTALRPIVDTLDGAALGRFLEVYRAALRRAYPPIADGTTLFPFPRGCSSSPPTEQNLGN